MRKDGVFLNASRHKSLVGQHQLDNMPGVLYKTNTVSQLGFVGPKELPSQYITQVSKSIFLMTVLKLFPTSLG